VAVSKLRNTKNEHIKKKKKTKVELQMSEDSRPGPSRRPGLGDVKKKKKSERPELERSPPPWGVRDAAMKNKGYQAHNAPTVGELREENGSV